MTVVPDSMFERYLAAEPRRREGRSVGLSAALKEIPNGARVWTSPFCGTPLSLLGGLDEHRAQWSSLEIVCGALLAPIAPVEHVGAPFRFITWQMSRPLEAVPPEALDIIPARYSGASDLFQPRGPYPVDVALVQVSAPGPDGRYSLGTSVGTVMDIIRTAPLVIAQVNRNMPYTFGAGEVAAEAFDLLVAMDGPLPSAPAARAGAEEIAIAEAVTPRIPHGATLQIGLGAVPEAILARLSAHRALGIHSGLLSDGLMELIDAGVITDEEKTADRGFALAAEVIGSERLFRWVDRNPRVRLAPARYTHSLDVLGRCPRLRMVNSAVEVALDGSVNAEGIAERVIAGPGGQPDFAEAAYQSPDAMSIVALPATARGGAVSRIVRRIDGGAPVTVSHHLADVVATEFGVASLRGRTLRERAASLGAIAHPRFRDALCWGDTQASAAPQ